MFSNTAPTHPNDIWECQRIKWDEEKKLPDAVHRPGTGPQNNISRVLHSWHKTNMQHKAIVPFNDRCSA